MARIMAKHSPQIHDQPLQEDEYIDMDLSSPATTKEGTTTASMFCNNTAMAASPQHPREFEFHMSASLDQWEPMASPADELFYKGKLLPLHLPPRIQMVEKLLKTAADKLSASTAPATPYQSCNASEANSCYASGELNVEHYFHECISAGIAVAEEVGVSEKKPWSKKFKFIRHLNLGLKLKASKAYIKTIFATKGGKPDDKNATSRTNEPSNVEFKAWKKNPFSHIRSNRYIPSPISNSATLGSKLIDECGHRRSFSSVIIHYSSSNKTSSVSSSSCSSSNSSSCIPSSNDSGVGPVLRRSSSASSEMDNPIQCAIAYCKRSQQLASVRKSASDAGFRFMSSSASKIAAESQDVEDLI